MALLTVTEGLKEIKRLKTEVMKPEPDKLSVSFSRDGKMSREVESEDFYAVTKDWVGEKIENLKKMRRIRSAIIQSNASTMIRFKSREISVAEALLDDGTLELERHLAERFLGDIRNIDFIINTERHYRNDALGRGIELEEIEYEKHDPANVKDFIERVREVHGSDIDKLIAESDAKTIIGFWEDSI